MCMTALHFRSNGFQDEASGGDEEITQEIEELLLASQSTPDATAAFKRAKLIWLALRIVLTPSFIQSNCPMCNLTLDPF